MAEAQAATKTSSRKKQRRSVPSGQVHVQATFNNTIITFSDKKGNVLSASSAGACGFRGSKKVQHMQHKSQPKKPLKLQRTCTASHQLTSLLKA